MLQGKMNRLLVTVLVLTVGVGLTACGSQEKTLSSEEQDAVLVFSEPATDNLFTGLVVGDYTAFSRDFDADMKAAIPDTGFAAWKQDLDSKLGSYVTRRLDRVTQLGDYYAVIYEAKFEQDDPVTVKVVFRVAEPHAISGLWFDSEKLRQK